MVNKSKFDTSDITVRSNPINFLRQRPSMFLPSQDADTYLMEQVLRDFEVFGAGDCNYGRRGAVSFVTSQSAWMPKPTRETNCFEEIIPLGNGYPNAHRTEVMIAAFAANFVAYIDGDLVASNGSLDTSELPLSSNALIWDTIIHNRA